jgi:carbon starvation protein CstA
VLTPEVLTQTAKDIGETTILSRTGGAPTLAVGMAQILHGIVAGDGMMAFWYHYAILFEALFILTTVDAGTRVGRFMIQELAGLAVPALKKTESWAANIVATALCVACWGYFLYQGVVDPLGGINTLWPLFGIANQMLAAIALIFACVCLVKMKRERYLWIPLLPAIWLVICTMTAGWQKMFSPDIKIGFLAHARTFADAANAGQLLAPAKSLAEMQRIIVNDRVDATLAGLFMLVVVAMIVFGIRSGFAAWRTKTPTVRETPGAVTA